MEDVGASAGFLICKLGVAFVAIACFGCALSLASATTRFAEAQDLEVAAETILRAVERIESYPAGSELRRSLPAQAGNYEITITGEFENGLQLLQVEVRAGASVSRSLVMSTAVNGGDFSILRKNPSELIVQKRAEISAELS